MSKKDKKRIAELEREESILAAKVRVMQYDIERLYAAKEQPQFEQGSIPQSEPKQGKTANDSPTQDGAKLDNSEQVCGVRLGRNWGKNYMCNAEAQIRNAMSSIRTSEQPEAEQKQPETSPIQSKLEGLVKYRTNQILLALEEELLPEKISHNVEKFAWLLQTDMQDFRRKHLDLGAVEQGKVEPKKTVQPDEKQGETDQYETKTKQVWIVQTNPQQLNSINPTFFFIESLDEKLVITHTIKPDDAMQFRSYNDAQNTISQIVAQSEHWLNTDCFKIIEKV